MSKVTTTFEAVDTGMVATIQKIERETKSMKDTTQKAEKQIDLSFGAMAKAGAGLAIGIGIVKGAFAALSGTIDQFGQALDMGGRLSDLSARTGETAGNLLLLERAFDNSGVGADKVGTAINKMQKFMVDAKDGMALNIDAMNQLGISYQMVSSLTPTEQLKMFAEKISAIQSPTERAAAAMTIFGKSGGQLLPFLTNFSGEINNAGDELGSMARIMDEKNAVFDTIADKIEVVKGKFVEFAAGLLSKVTPAIELIVTALSRIDAAAIGEKLAEAFIGAGTAMNGFSSALSALKMGDFADAWSIAIISVELQMKQTINQIYKYATATIDGIMAGLKSMFGPDSAIVSILVSTFELIASKMGKVIAGGIESILGGVIPGLSEKVKGAINLMDSEINLSKVKIQSAIQDLKPQLSTAAGAFGDGFKNSFETAKPLIDTLALEGELMAMQAGVTAKEAEKAAKAAEDALKTVKSENPFTPMEKASDRISLKMRKVGDDVKGMVDKIKELTNIEKLKLELKEAQAKKQEGIAPIQEDFKNQLEQGRFKQAERTIQKIQRREDEASIRINEKGDRDRRNISDIAKAEGIDTFGKSQKQLRKEILEKREGKKIEDLKKKQDPEEGKKQAEKPKEDQLLDIVKMIKDIVGKIEPKLPTHALAL